jgi:N-acetyl-alpha-D-glucosaminyl L-malate synthase BshA
VFYNIQKEIPAKLMLIGDGPDKEDAENLCDELGITEKVVFFGRSNEIDKILCFSDLFLLPSETESFGLAALEAMASGVPVISSNTGGIPEGNVNGITGFLSDVGDVEDMSKNAIHILSDPARLKQFKQNAKERSYIFDIHNIVPQYEKLYEETLEKSLQLLP